MNEATCLLSLQELDLKIARVREALENPPELKPYRTAITNQKRVEALLKGLKGQHKDLDMDLADLDEEQALLRADLEEVRTRGERDAANYRSLADVREQYASLAKKLEKSEFKSEQAMERLVEVEAKEARAREAFEHWRATAQRAAKLVREALAEGRRTLEALETERGRYAAELSEDTLADYERASERFNGLGVERLDGRHPSVCRMALQPDAVKLIHRAGPVTRCPYCRRILVVDEAGG